MDRRTLKMMPIGNVSSDKFDKRLYDPATITAVATAVSTVGGGVMQYMDTQKQKKEMKRQEQLAKAEQEKQRKLSLEEKKKSSEDIRTGMSRLLKGQAGGGLLFGGDTGVQGATTLGG